MLILYKCEYLFGGLRSVLGTLVNAIGKALFLLHKCRLIAMHKLSIIMAKNSNLHAAKNNKKDEFYTQMPDIANELKHYKQHFVGKTVLCNCDDPYESNFFKFFALNFKAWGLKKLIATCYNGSPVQGSELLLSFDIDEEPLTPHKVAHKIEITEIPDANGDDAIDLSDVQFLLQNDKNVISVLKGNGDFRSPECVELLKEADIVVTNPPFSLFREYVAQLMTYDKQFLIIGNQNAITYKEIFPLIKENKVWLGITMDGRNHFFRVPDNYPLTEANCKIENGVKYACPKGCVWFTNLEHNKRKEWFDLYKTYFPEEYPKYDNYEAIEVCPAAKIPMDYDGIMGVPITFLHKYCPEQFDIVGATESEGKGFSNGLWIETSRIAQPVVKGERVYKRIFIRKKQ